MTTHALPLRAPAGERVLAQPVLDGLFLATILTVTFHKLQWELAGSLTLSDVLTSVFLVVFVWDRLERGDARLTRTFSLGKLGRVQAQLDLYNLLNAGPALNHNNNYGSAWLT